MEQSHIEKLNKLFIAPIVLTEKKMVVQNLLLMQSR